MGRKSKNKEVEGVELRREFQGKTISKNEGLKVG